MEAIWDYTAAEWGVAQSERYVDAIVDAFADVAQFPKSASTCDHIRQGYRRRVVEHHVIYFRVMSYGIAVIRVLHVRMDASRYI